MNRREALRTIGSGGALGGALALVVAVPGCAPTEAPAATASDPMLEALKWFRKHEDVHARMCLGDDDGAADAYRVETVDYIRNLIIEDKPRITTDEGAHAALYVALTSGVFIDPFTHALVRQTLAYLDGRTA